MSEIIVAQKFFREFNRVFVEMFESKIKILSFKKVVAVVEKLGFISQKNIKSLENDELT